MSGISDDEMTCDAPECQARADMYVDALVGIDAYQGEHASKFLCASHSRLVVERLQLCKSHRACAPGEEPEDGYAAFTLEPESASMKAAVLAVGCVVCGTCAKEAWALVEGHRVVVPF